MKTKKLVSRMVCLGLILALIGIPAAVSAEETSVWSVTYHSMSDSDFSALQERGEIAIQSGSNITPSVSRDNMRGLALHSDFTGTSYVAAPGVKIYFNETLKSDEYTETRRLGYRGDLKLDFNLALGNARMHHVYLLGRKPGEGVDTLAGGIYWRASNQLARAIEGSTVHELGTFGYNSSRLNCEYTYTNRINTATGTVEFDTDFKGANPAASVSGLAPFGDENERLVGILICHSGGGASNGLLAVDNIKLTRTAGADPDEAVIEAADKLTVEQLTGNPGNVVKTVNLPNSIDGATVTWSSDNPDVVSPVDGTVTQSPKGSQKVCLTAVISKDGGVVEKRFRLTVAKALDYQITAVAKSGDGAQVTLTGNEESANAKLLVAAYQGATLVGAGMTEITKDSVSQPVSVTLDTEGADKLTAFVWSSLESLTPLSEAKTETITQ